MPIISAESWIDPNAKLVKAGNRIRLSAHRGCFTAEVTEVVGNMVRFTYLCDPTVYETKTEYLTADSPEGHYRLAESEIRRLNEAPTNKCSHDGADKCR